MIAIFLLLSAITGYSGPCTHPMIEKRGGNWYCTECGQMRS